MAALCALGRDPLRVVAGLQAAHDGFARMDNDARAIFSSEPSLWAERLNANRRAFSNEEPKEYSIFVYFDLSTNTRLIEYVASIRSVIDRCLQNVDGKKVRYSALSLQHTTSFIEIIGEDLTLSTRLMDDVEAKYRTILGEFVPFNVLVHGPHLAKTGVVILELVAHSDQFFFLRDAASRDTSFLPEGAKRGIHSIIHSTVGYIAEASQSEMLSLHDIFIKMRSKIPEISTRVREARLTGTRNKELTPDQRRIPFQGRRCPSLSNVQISELLNEIKRESSVFLEDPILAEIVRNEAIYWIENARDNTIWSAAYELLCSLPTYRDALRTETALH